MSNLPEIDSHSYQIPLKNLEDAHSKVRQSSAVLAMLGDWTCADGRSVVGHEYNDKLMQILFLLMELIQDIEKLLPEV